MNFARDVAFERLKGLTIRAIEVDKTNDDVITFATDGGLFRMSHSQDCCEHVYVEDIAGDLDDLIDNPVLLAEEVSNEDPEAECGQWTFYKLSTIKGSVTIRWYGSSNGYYSTSVDFEQLP